jgi:hypothetical protein
VKPVIKHLTSMEVDIIPVSPVTAETLAATSTLSIVASRGGNMSASVKRALSIRSVGGNGGDGDAGGGNGSGGGGGGGGVAMRSHLTIPLLASGHRPLLLPQSRRRYAGFELSSVCNSDLDELECTWSNTLELCDKHPLSLPRSDYFYVADELDEYRLRLARMRQQLAVAEEAATVTLVDDDDSDDNSSDSDAAEHKTPDIKLLMSPIEKEMSLQAERNTETARADRARALTLATQLRAKLDNTLHCDRATFCAKLPPHDADALQHLRLVLGVTAAHVDRCVSVVARRLDAGLKGELALAEHNRLLAKAAARREREARKERRRVMKAKRALTMKKGRNEWGTFGRSPRVGHPLGPQSQIYAPETPVSQRNLTTLPEDGDSGTDTDTKSMPAHKRVFSFGSSAIAELSSKLDTPGSIGRSNSTRGMSPSQLENLSYTERLLFQEQLEVSDHDSDDDESSGDEVRERAALQRRASSASSSSSMSAAASASYASRSSAAMDAAEFADLGVTPERYEELLTARVVAQIDAWLVSGRCVPRKVCRSCNRSLAFLNVISKCKARTHESLRYLNIATATRHNYSALPINIKQEIDIDIALGNTTRDFSYVHGHIDDGDDDDENIKRLATAEERARAVDDKARARLREQVADAVLEGRKDQARAAAAHARARELFVVSSSDLSAHVGAQTRRNEHREGHALSALRKRIEQEARYTVVVLGLAKNAEKAALLRCV